MSKSSKLVRKPTPDQSLLKELLDYDPLTGDLTWKPRPREMFKSTRMWGLWNSKHAGKLAFNSSVDGYLWGRILGKRFRAHRIIWKWMTGVDAEEIDHVNHLRSDNRWENLREVSREANNQNTSQRSNNRSGCTGVFWQESSLKWCAQIRIRGRNKYLGIFDTIDDAIAARKAAELRFGFHPNHGT